MYIGILIRLGSWSNLMENGVSFTIYQANGLKVIQWFKTVDDLLKSMLANPNDAYHRN